ncbi:MAG: stage III sporulation AC/AD family protein [Oscillospiraceae bacterium]|nr:stage III sporulation AC/AD family protein [Oscillospiraceae bacterium]MDE7304071.1 stage III sporulation AC/AD family protein [Oscillospiraceae bacterium]
MINIVSVAGICIIASVLCKLFGAAGSEYALYIKIAAAAAVLSVVIMFVSPVAEAIRGLYARAGADGEYLTILFKALGICYITQFACDICRDSGENALATQAELAGKLSLLILALPLFDSLSEIVSGLI